MAPTYAFIKSVILTGTQSSISFSAIPQNYTDLILRCSTRTNNESFGPSVTLQINSSNGAANTWIYNSSTSLTDGRATGALYRAGVSTDTSMTADTFSSFSIYMPDYSVGRKIQMSGIGTAESNSATNFRLFTSAMLWNSTSTVSSITLTSNSGSFVSGSSFYLYGIRNT